MLYNNLGNTGLKISRLSFGSWVTFANQLNEKKAMDCMAIAYDHGVNFFDNAEVYAQGESEKINALLVSMIFWPGKILTIKSLGM